jgi:hypothetical protein
MEILALRQQLAMVTQRNPKRLRFRRRERLFWVRLYPLWPGYLQTLHVFKADTLVRWHSKGFSPVLDLESAPSPPERSSRDTSRSPRARPAHVSRALPRKPDPSDTRRDLRLRPRSSHCPASVNFIIATSGARPPDVMSAPVLG